MGGAIPHFLRRFLRVHGPRPLLVACSIATGAEGRDPTDAAGTYGTTDPQSGRMPDSSIFGNM